MSGENLIPFHPSRRARRAVVEDGAIAMLVFVIVEAMLFAGMLSAFMLTRAAASGVWPPAGLPLSLVETAVNTAALLVSGALVFQAAQLWEKRDAGIGALLLAAIGLGAFFLIFQGIESMALIREGLSLTAGQHGKFFGLIVGIYGAHALGALIFLGVARLRLKRGSLSSSAFSAARILWYFVVGVWPVLYLCLYL